MDDYCGGFWSPVFISSDEEDEIGKDEDPNNNVASDNPNLEVQFKEETQNHQSTPGIPEKSYSNDVSLDLASLSDTPERAICLSSESASNDFCDLTRDSVQEGISGDQDGDAEIGACLDSSEEPSRYNEVNDGQTNSAISESSGGSKERQFDTAADGHIRSGDQSHTGSVNSSADRSQLKDLQSKTDIHPPSTVTTGVSNDGTQSCELNAADNGSADLSLSSSNEPEALTTGTEPQTVDFKASATTANPACPSVGELWEKFKRVVKKSGGQLPLNTEDGATAGQNDLTPACSERNTDNVDPPPISTDNSGDHDECILKDSNFVPPDNNALEDQLLASMTALPPSTPVICDSYSTDRTDAQDTVAYTQNLSHLDSMVANLPLYNPPSGGGASVNQPGFRAYLPHNQYMYGSPNQRYPFHSAASLVHLQNNQMQFYQGFMSRPHLHTTDGPGTNLPQDYQFNTREHSLRNNISNNYDDSAGLRQPGSWDQNYIPGYPRHQPNFSRFAEFRFGRNKTHKNNDSVKDRPFLQCSMCDKRFSSPRSLDTHLKGHTERFMCIKCGGKFMCREALSSHACDVNSLSIIEFPLCRICGKYFAGSGAWCHHIQEHRSMARGGRHKQWHCVSCDTHYSDKQRALNHVKTCHSGSFEEVIKWTSIPTAIVIAPDDGIIIHHNKTFRSDIPSTHEQVNAAVCSPKGSNSGYEDSVSQTGEMEMGKEDEGDVMLLFMEKGNAAPEDALSQMSRSDDVQLVADGDTNSAYVSSATSEIEVIIPDDDDVCAVAATDSNNSPVPVASQLTNIDTESAIRCWSSPVAHDISPETITPESTEDTTDRAQFLLKGLLHTLNSAVKREPDVPTNCSSSSQDETLSAHEQSPSTDGDDTLDYPGEAGLEVLPDGSVLLARPAHQTRALGDDRPLKTQMTTVHRVPFSCDDCVLKFHDNSGLLHHLLITHMLPWNEAKSAVARYDGHAKKLPKPTVPHVRESDESSISSASSKCDGQDNRAEHQTNSRSCTVQTRDKCDWDEENDEQGYNSLVGVTEGGVHKFVCGMCYRCFSSKNKWVQHMTNHSKDSPLTQEENNKKLNAFKRKVDDINCNNVVDSMCKKVKTSKP